MADIVFTTEQNETWAEMYRRQEPRVREHACSEYLQGFELLALPSDFVPPLHHLDSRVSSATGWRVVRTGARTADADEWYRHLDRREFLLTHHIRSRDALGRTLEPDMFHDAFGHLPFFMLPQYVRIQERFASAFLSAASDEEKENVKRLAWYSTEFGMKREEGGLKVFGAGLLPGGDEFDNAAAGRMNYRDFTIENLIGQEDVTHEQPRDLFVIESLEQLESELARYFDPILERSRKV